MTPDTGGEVPEGAALFARYAYPPNSLGYCGPEQSEALLRAAVDGDGESVRRLARRFEAAWPYLQLIASANGRADPLDERVVEAYWLGNRLLDQVDPGMFAGFLRDRFGCDIGTGGERSVAERCTGSFRPHHNFHVFSVYPWVAILQAGRSRESLTVLEKCRIRWGQVQEAGPDDAVVASRCLSWNGELGLGDVRLETVSFRHDGRAMIDPPADGDWVAMHWDWICDRLTPEQVVELSAHTARQLDAVNGRVPAALS